jgi:hypothetical protein
VSGRIFKFSVQGCLERQINFIFVTLQHNTRLKSQILESEILVLCESVLQELSTNILNIIIL